MNGQAHYLPFAPARAPVPVQETARILALPRWTGPARNFTTRDFLLPNAPLRKGKAVELRPTQLAMLSTIHDAGGAFIGAGVGEGKTLVAFLAGTVLDVDAVIILVRPPEVRQTGEAWAEWANFFRFHPNTQVYPYSFLSQPGSTDLLERHAKKVGANRLLIVADEMQALRDKTTARTMRLLRHFVAHPNTRFVGMTGTHTKDSLHDFSHLICLALGSGSPVPYDTRTLDAWAGCIDAEGEAGPSDWQFVDELLRWAGFDPATLAGDRKRAAAQKAFRERMKFTRGVFMTTEQSIDAEIRIYPVAPRPPTEVVEAINRIESGLHPEGIDIYESEMEQVVDARRAAMGFYYVWNWSLVGRQTPDEEWMSARKSWHRWVRLELESHATTHYDSPFLVQANCERACMGEPVYRHPPAGMLESWWAWRDMRKRYNIDEMREARWISTYLVDEVMGWVRAQREPILVWYEDVAVGDLIGKRFGIPVFGEGSQVPTDAAITCALSRRVHGTGRNLQPWFRQVLLGCPANGSDWEQLLGRTHRPGQTSSYIDVVLPIPTGRVLDAFEHAVKDAHYVTNTTGQRARLVTATYLNPLPSRRNIP